MSDQSNTELVALERIRDEFEDLVGTETWHKIESQFIGMYDEFQRLNDLGEKTHLDLELIDFIARYPQVNQRYQEIRDSLDLYKYVLSNLASLSRVLQLPTAVSDRLLMQAVETRKILIPTGGVGGANSIKLNNIEFEFGSFGQLVSGILIALQDSLDKLDPLTIAASVLLIASSLYTASTKDISEKEATVFWGFIRVADDLRQADEETILSSTNEERRKLQLSELSDTELRRSLSTLTDLKCVKASDGKGKWRIIERYRMA